MELLTEAKEPVISDGGITSTLPDAPQGDIATAVFNGLSDSHTAEITLPDGSFAALQFDINSAVAADIASLSEGDGFTFRYITDSSTGAMKLLTVE